MIELIEIVERNLEKRDFDAMDRELMSHSKEWVYSKKAKHLVISDIWGIASRAYKNRESATRAITRLLNVLKTSNHMDDHYDSDRIVGISNELFSRLGFRIDVSEPKVWDFEENVGKWEVFPAYFVCDEYRERMNGEDWAWLGRKLAK